MVFAKKTLSSIGHRRGSSHMPARARVTAVNKSERLPASFASSVVTLCPVNHAIKARHGPHTRTHRS